LPHEQVHHRPDRRRCRRQGEVTRRFEARGIAIADADLAARRVVEPGQPALARVVETFGADVLQADGRLDRRRLREHVFADADARHRLEAILHPAIREHLAVQCRNAAGPYAIAAIPLLTEVGGRSAYPWLDRILLVDAPLELQHARLMRRDDIDEALAAKMIAAQAGRAERRALADEVVLNDGHPDHLDAAVERLDAYYRTLAAMPAG
jgi:dephospho-CoA kinase